MSTAGSGDDEDLERPIVEASWLRKRLPVAEMDATYGGPEGREAGSGQAGKASDSAWLAMRGAMRQGDEIWEYSTPGHLWRGLCGREGVVLMRAGKAVREIVTAMS